MGTLGGSHSIEIEASLELCFKIAADIDAAPRWQGSMKEVEVHTRDSHGRAIDVTTTADAKITQLRTKLRFSYDDAPNGMRWEQVEGDLKWMTGSWAFAETEGGLTQATYTMEGDPGRMLSMLIRGPVEEQLRHKLVVLPAEGLKEQAESRR
jgi:uncharacterized membrane protein